MGEPPYPCLTCSAAGHTCIYTESAKKVMVSESYLMELQAQARGEPALSETREGTSERTVASSPDIELGFTGSDNWVVGSSGEYRTFIPWR